MFGILGINARSLLYIKKFNPSKQILLLTNKYKTKEFLGKRGIPVPTTYAHITSRKQLFEFTFSSLPSTTYAIKPNKGSQGNGIIIVQDTKKYVDEPKEEGLWEKVAEKLQQRNLHWIKNACDALVGKKKPKEMFLYNGKWKTDIELKRELIAILDGMYNVKHTTDSILIEEKLVPGEDFKMFCQYGLADIRIITFNLVPIAAMVRIPTQKSGGKANLAQGGIACGIDICTGKITSLMLGKGGERYENRFPEMYKDFFGYTMPFWEDLLSFSVNAQYFLNIGFIGFDRVITPRGPKLLEINGRPGLEIQNITGRYFKNIMEKIEDLNVTTPEKGLEISKTLFGSETIADSRKGIVYLSQRAKLKIPIDAEHKKIIETIAIVDLTKKKNYLSSILAEKIQAFYAEKELAAKQTESQKPSYPKKNTRKTKQLSSSSAPKKYGNLTLVLPESNITTQTAFIVSKNLEGNKVLLGTNLLKNYLIRSIHKSHVQIDFISPKNIVESEVEDLQIFDIKLHELTKSITLAPCLRPINYLEQFDIFVAKNGEYNPQFRYRYPKNERIALRQEQLEKLTIFFNKKNFQSRFAWLFKEKLESLQLKINLIKAYKRQDYDAIAHYNECFFGKMQESLAKTSQEYVQKRKEERERGIKKPGIKRGKMLRFKEIVKKVEEYLEQKGLADVQIIKSSSNLSRITTARKGEKIYLKVATGVHATFVEKKLLEKLAHEVDIHIQRYVNGKKSGWYILTDGTAYHTKDEEGLAIWYSEKVLKDMMPGYENIAIYKKYYFFKEAFERNFEELGEVIAHYKNRITFSGLFNTILKYKRGLKDTSVKTCGYRKEKVYLEGYQKVKKHIETNGQIEKLLCGKIKIDDMQYL